MHYGHPSLLSTLNSQPSTIPVRTRLPGRVGGGRSILPPTRFGIIIFQLGFFCSKSPSRFRNSRNSRCIPKVTVPTKKKHIGRKQKNAGFHAHESEPICVESAVSERKAQNAAGIQWVMILINL
jgi:hypothetical protein